MEGNMDLSVCLDFFAVITYITDYFTKDESGTSGLLKVAAKHTSEMKETDQKQCCQMGRLYTTMVVYTTIWPKWSYFGRLFNLKVVFHQKLVIFWSPFHSLHYNVDVYFR